MCKFGLHIIGKYRLTEGIATFKLRYLCNSLAVLTS